MDLNLLVALDALLRHRSVTAAGLDVGLSQPAMSSALMRLRRMFGDDLLVRVGRQMHLTPRAEGLIEPVADILAAIEVTVTKPEFDPATARNEFTIATADYVTAVLLPPLVRRLAEDAPGVQVHVVAADTGQAQNPRGPSVWIVPSVFLQGTHTTLFEDRWMCALWRGHPDVGDTMTVEQFLGLPHAAFALGEGMEGSDSVALRQLGLVRNVQVTVPNFSVLPFVLTDTPMVALVQERLGRQLAEVADIRLIPPPVDLPPIEVAMQWAPRAENDPAQAWFRRVVAEVAAAA